MAVFRRTRSDSALDSTTKRVESTQDFSFEFSVPRNRAEAVNGEYINGIYEYGSYTTDGRGKPCLRCLKWSLTTATTALLPSEVDVKKRSVRLDEKWGEPFDMLKSECPLCRLFALHATDYQFVNGPMEGRSYGLYELKVRREQPPWMRSSPPTAARFWHLDPTSAPKSGFPQPAGAGACIGVTDATAIGNHGVLHPVVIDSAVIDYSLIQAWLSECDLHHGEDCNFKSADVLPSLRLIDCLSNPPKVVGAQEQHKYVALSYVWGTGGVGSHFSGDTLVWKLLPGTIRDAMTVTRKLGLRYLWVDRYW